MDAGRKRREPAAPCTLRMTHKIEVIAQAGEAPEAVLAPYGQYRSERLIVRGRFDASLSMRWERLVTCTPEFSSWWRVHAGRPRGFVLEVFA